jgi:hypothetical protein
MKALFDTLCDAGLKNVTDLDLGGNPRLTIQSARSIAKLVKKCHKKLVSLTFDNMPIAHKDTLRTLISPPKTHFPNLFEVSLASMKLYDEQIGWMDTGLTEMPNL